MLTSKPNVPVVVIGPPVIGDVVAIFVTPEPPPAAFSVVPVKLRLVPSVISSVSPEPAVARPSNLLVVTFCILAYVTASFAIVAANDPVPDPPTSPVSVIVWSPVLIPELLLPPPPETVVHLLTPSESKLT